MTDEACIAKETPVDQKRIIHRQPEFGDFKDLPDLWAAGDSSTTSILSHISLILPEAEQALIRSVNVFSAELDDPIFKKEVQNFCKQEGTHSIKHRKFNESLQKLGYKVDAFGKGIKYFTTLSEWIFPKKMMLSFSAFIEHLTAISSATLFRFPELRENWHPEALKFWIWHAAEELEHKSLVYDVYKTVGGGYLLRALSALMFITLLSFIPIVLVPILLLLKVFSLIQKTSFKSTSEPGAETGPEPLPGSESLQSANNDWNILKYWMSHLLNYFKPGFHPSDNDHSNYLEQWKVDNRDISLF